MTPRPINILVADDNEDDILLTREALQGARLLNVIHVAHDGVDAMTYLRGQAPFQAAERPGMVLMDINMPRMNGFETLSAMKQDPVLRSIPVVILTVSDRDADVARAYGLGACSYIRKPTDFQEFALAMARFETYWTLVARRPYTAGERGVPSE